MSVLPAMPSTGALSASHREPGAQLSQPAASRVIQATSQPMLASAVEQSRPMERSVATFLKKAGAELDRKNRLVGPPPAFEVNMLQQIRETGLELDLPDIADATLTDLQGIAETPLELETPPPAVQMPEPRTGAAYAELNSLVRADARPEQTHSIDLTM